MTVGRSDRRVELWVKSSIRIFLPKLWIGTEASSMVWNLFYLCQLKPVGHSVSVSARLVVPGYYGPRKAG
jgi:hypothetical protein